MALLSPACIVKLTLNFSLAINLESLSLKDKPKSGLILQILNVPSYKFVMKISQGFTDSQTENQIKSGEQFNIKKLQDCAKLLKAISMT